MLSLPHILAATGPVIQCGGKGVLPGCDPANSFDPATITKTLFSTGINFFIAAIAFVAFGYLVKGGIGFITAKGSTDKIKTAQKTMIAAIIGLILAISSFILVQIVANLAFPTT